MLYVSGSILLAEVQRYNRRQGIHNFSSYNPLNKPSCLLYHDNKEYIWILFVIRYNQYSESWPLQIEEMIKINEITGFKLFIFLGV